MRIFHVWGESFGIPVPAPAPGADVRLPITTFDHVLFGVLDVRRRGCPSCRRVSTCAEQFLCIPVPISFASVAAFMDLYAQPERLYAACPICHAAGPSYCSRSIRDWGTLFWYSSACMTCPWQGSRRFAMPRSLHPHRSRCMGGAFGSQLPVNTSGPICTMGITTYTGGCHQVYGVC